MDVVEGALRVDELDQAAAVLLDQALLDRYQILVGDRFAEMFAHAQQALDRTEGGAGQHPRRSREMVGKARERAGKFRLQQLERDAELLIRRQRHFDLRRAWIVDDQ